MTTTQLNEEVITTAICITEYKVDCDDGSAFDRYIENHNSEGAWGLRTEIMALAISLEQAFEALGENKRMTFQEDYLETPCWDFSVVPWICEKAAESGKLNVSKEAIINWVEVALQTLPVSNGQ
jgi:hypothetical protein